VHTPPQEERRVAGFQRFHSGLRLASRVILHVAITEAIPILANAGIGFQPSADRRFVLSVQYISWRPCLLRMWYKLDYPEHKRALEQMIELLAAATSAHS
jgi:hypothetical protein